MSRHTSKTAGQLLWEKTKRTAKSLESCGNGVLRLNLKDKDMDKAIDKIRKVILPAYECFTKALEEKTEYRLTAATPDVFKNATKKEE